MVARLLHSLVRYRVEHLKVNFISPCTHVLFSIYLADGKALGNGKATKRHTHQLILHHCFEWSVFMMSINTITYDKRVP